MRLLIVARERLQGEETVAALDENGRSLRLQPSSPLEAGWSTAFEVGELWEVDGAGNGDGCDELIVCSRQRLEILAHPARFIASAAVIRDGGLETLYRGELMNLPPGPLHLLAGSPAAGDGACFWRPDRPLRLQNNGRATRYLYSDEAGDRSIGFVGLQDPVDVIPAGTLVRVSLTRPWSSPGRPEEPPRCFLQLSGWFDQSPAQGRAAAGAGRSSSVTSLPSEAAAKPSVEAARRELSRVFGYQEFRPLQESIITSVLARRDTLGVMPTGSGKSLCYQIPALLFEGLTVVVSPLLALMKDQVDQLRQAGVTAVTLNSMQSDRDYSFALRSIRSGEAKLLYVAPETLLRPDILDILERSRLEFLAIDEAHCISEWGHDFRPDYRRMRLVRDRFSGAVCLALTATATARVQQDLRSSLGIADQDSYVAGFDRPNLHLEVRRREHGAAQVESFLKAHPAEAGIVYCSKREQVNSLVKRLQSNGARALPYHAGLENAVRIENQRLFTHDAASIMVATIAFGMGINKPDVRFILHYNLPDCLETYYQQIGRAGRDGLRADCLLLLARGDVGTTTHFIQEGAEAERVGRTLRLQAMLRYAEATGCRRAVLLPYFDDAAPGAPCGMCDNCLAEAAGRVPVDVSDDARLFLHCVQQTGQRFGAVHVVEVLRGSRSARVLKWRHDQLPAYGSGRGGSDETWRELADRLIERQILDVDMEHGTLRITRAGEAVIAGAPVVISMAPPQTQSAPLPAAEESDPVLFEALRSHRRELAAQAGVPPYVIFSDRTLRDMSGRCPRTPDELLEVHGVGRHKLSVYGSGFLKVIAEHPGDLSSDSGPTAASTTLAGSSRRAAGDRSYEVGEVFAEGASLAEIAADLDIKDETVLNHLLMCQEAGFPVDTARLLPDCTAPEPLQSRVLSMLDEMGDERLGPIHDELNGAVSYRDLHLLRLYYRGLTGA